MAITYTSRPTTVAGFPVLDGTARLAAWSPVPLTVTKLGHPEIREGLDDAARGAAALPVHDNGRRASVNVTALPAHVIEVLLLCAQPQVVEVDASRVVAGVADDESRLDWTTLPDPVVAGHVAATALVGLADHGRDDALAHANECMP